MNIHPIIIHFPLALLSLYAVFEFIWFRRLTRSSEWFYIKATLVIIGTVMALTAWYTGGIARDLITDQSLRPLIASHEKFAEFTVFIFGILAAGYFFASIKRLIPQSRIYNIFTQLWKLVFYFQELITETPLAPLLALVGLLSLLITGALGGTIVYGGNTDPFTKAIYQLIN